MNNVYNYDVVHNLTRKTQDIVQQNLKFDGILSTGYNLSYTYANNSQQIANIADACYRADRSGGTYSTGRQQGDVLNEKAQSFTYDANGNMTYVSTGKKLNDSTLQATSSRQLLWDEENRLLAISDNGFVSNYWYDAAGERTVKQSGGSEGVFVNGVFSGGSTKSGKFTAYISPYMVVSSGGNYRKHIYMGSQRIVNKLSNSGIFAASPVTVTQQQARYALQSHKIKERFDSLGVVYNGTAQTGGLMSATPASTAGSYFYHPDHLGSSSMITDGTGALTQHIQYVPFGEVFVEERTNSWSTPYKFNGKELDEETGLYYYHARYYDPRLSVWMSVDPLAEKYPNIGSYVYCVNSPVMRIDPDGRDDFEINSKGKIINRIENKDRDAFFIVELNEEGDYNRTGQHIEFEYNTVKVSPKFKGYDVYEVKQKDKGVKLFEFFADNTKVEWGMVKYLNNNVTITTSHSERSLKGNVGELIKELKLVGSVESITHSHPGGTPYPSGLDSKKSDIGAAKAYEERYGNVLLYIYLPGIDKGVRENYINYNSQSLPIDFKGHTANKNLPAEFIIRPTKK